LEGETFLSASDHRKKKSTKIHLSISVNKTLKIQLQFFGLETCSTTKRKVSKDEKIDLFLETLYFFKKTIRFEYVHILLHAQLFKGKFLLGSNSSIHLNLNALLSEVD
jgi:hypothetical protein